MSRSDLSPRPSLKGRALVAQGVSLSPLEETGEGFVRVVTVEQVVNQPPSGFAISPREAYDDNAVGSGGERADGGVGESSVRAVKVEQGKRLLLSFESEMK